MDSIITPEMVDASVDIANLALARHDLVVEIVMFEDSINGSDFRITAPEWQITLRQPTPEERRNGVRVVTKVGA